MAVALIWVLCCHSTLPLPLTVPITSSALDDLILKLRAEQGMTFVVVTHELPSIFKIADRCAMFDKARRSLIALGDPRELRTSSTDSFVLDFFNRGEHHG